MSRNNQWEAEFQAVYSRNFDAVSRYCLRRLPEQVAQDAVSDVFLTAWRRFDSMPSGEERLPWLYGVARNVVRNAQRSSRRSLRLSAKLKSEPRHPEPSPETQIIRNEQDQELIDALESLSHRIRKSSGSGHMRA